MSEHELQELSRQAAGCLPKDFAISKHGFPVEPNGQTGFGATQGRGKWLHESTEACTEIMVRVLLPAGCDLMGEIGPEIEEGAGCFLIGNKEPDDAGAYVYLERNNDPMLAFRVAVLRALIALGATK